MINDILKAGLQGIQTGISRAAENAERVVRSFSPESEESPVEPLIALKQDENQVKASAKVIKVADELTKSVLDIA